MAAVVCEGRIKYEGAAPVMVPREAVIRTGEDETELAGRMKCVGGEIVGKAVEARPGREGRISPSRAEKVEGNLGVGKEVVPEVVGEVGRLGGF
jgi:hypothetical protein